jgi:hypothetical protein
MTLEAAMTLSRAGRYALLLAAVAAPALGAQPARPHTASFQAVLDCRRVTEDAARLRCFDAAAATLGEAEAKGDVVVIDRAQAQAAHKEAFGLPVPSLDFITRAINPGDTDQVEGVVKSARADASGYWTMQLEDGAVWRQIDGTLFRPPKPGSKVRVRRASLGSFVMNIDTQPAVKVHRDR